MVRIRLASFLRNYGPRYFQIIKHNQTLKWFLTFGFCKPYIRLFWLLLLMPLIFCAALAVIFLEELFILFQKNFFFYKSTNISKVNTGAHYPLFMYHCFFSPGLIKYNILFKNWNISCYYYWIYWKNLILSKKLFC